MQWSVELHEEAARELRALPTDLQARFLRVAELIETFGPHAVREPHVKPIDGKLWEIRMKGASGIARALYVTVIGRRIVVLRCFVKKQQKTPAREIAVALSRMKEVIDG